MVDQKKCINKEEVSEAINLLKGAVMIAYPAYYELPEWEPVYLILEN